jgi:predicted pyridoxine 5'-phosphate oxidase superfamily flavin-nucleotide-binding protein
MSDMNHTTRPGDEADADIPVLTDIIDDEYTTPARLEQMTVVETVDETSPMSLTAAPEAATTSPLPSLEQIEAELTARLSAELAMQIPVLLEAALREHLPRAMGAKLQAELLSALANALPGAAQNAAAELSSTLAFEVGGLLEQRIEEEVRRAVSDEVARISADHQLPH